jgi:NADH dehydrogenase
VELVYGDVTNYGSLRSAFEGIDMVFHLAAILLSTQPSEFERINTQGTRNVISACQDAGVRRLLYVSSISVTYPILTPYGQSKLDGESLVRESGLDWTIVRPTLVIGDGGGIEFNMYARYVSRFPVYFLPGGGKALKRPVRSADLVQGIAAAGLEDCAIWKTYALAGPSVMTMAQMAEAILRSRGLKHRMLKLPWWLCRRLAVLKAWIGGTGVSAEQALAGFLYDAAPSIESAENDLGYHPKSPFEA